MRKVFFVLSELDHVGSSGAEKFSRNSGGLMILEDLTIERENGLEPLDRAAGIRSSRRTTRDHESQPERQNRRSGYS